MVATGKRAMGWIRSAVAAALVLACWPGAALGGGSAFAAASETPQADEAAANECTVTFNPNGGTHTGALGTGTAAVAVKVRKGAILETSQYSSPTRSGHVFDYWSTEQDHDASKYKPHDLTAPITSDITLYARWSACVYPITYDESCYDNSGNMTGEGTMPISYAYSAAQQAITLVPPKRADYTFVEWDVSGGGATVSESTLTIPANATDPISLKAVWSNTMGDLKTRTDDGGVKGPGESGTAVDIRLKSESISHANKSLVVFYPRNGQDPETRYVMTSSEKVGSTPVPLDKGEAAEVGNSFSFEGWSTDPDKLTSATTVNADTVPTTHMNVYGTWKSKIEHILLDVPAYDAKNPDAPLYATAKDGTATLPVELDDLVGGEDMYGYEIEGWYTDEALTSKWDVDEDNSGTTPTSKTLYAKCVKDVTLHMDGGTITTTPATPADEFEWTVSGTDYKKTFQWSDQAKLTLPYNRTATTPTTSNPTMTIAKTSWQFMNWCIDAKLEKPVDADITGTKLVQVGSASVASDYYAHWDPMVTIKFFQYADDGKTGYDNTIEIAAHSTQKVKLPAQTDLQIGGKTDNAGLTGHRLYKWVYVPEATEAGGTGIDANQKTSYSNEIASNHLNPGAEVELAAIVSAEKDAQGNAVTVDSITAPKTLRIYAGWQATIEAELDVDASDFQASIWLDSVPSREIEALEPITLTSSTLRVLSLSAQNTTTADERTVFGQSFKKLSPDGSMPDNADMQNTAITFTPDAEEQTGGTFTYMSGEGDPGSSVAVGTIGRAYMQTPGTYTDTTLTGSLKLTLPSTLRTLRESEARALDTQSSGETVRKGFGTVKWTVAFSKAYDGYMFLFGSETSLSF